MWFWIFMFICNLLIPLSMIVIGRIMYLHPPRRINGLYGYRTSMSMKNMETWTFANKAIGRIWFVAGWFLLIPGIAVQLLFYNSDDHIISITGGVICLIQCVVLISSVYPVEKALKKNFDKNGVRKQEGDSSALGDL